MTVHPRTLAGEQTVAEMLTLLVHGDSAGYSSATADFIRHSVLAALDAPTEPAFELCGAFSILGVLLSRTLGDVARLRGTSRETELQALLLELADYLAGMP